MLSPHPLRALKTKSNPLKKMGIGSPVFCTFLLTRQPDNPGHWKVLDKKKEGDKVGGVHWLIVTSVRVQCTALSSFYIR